MVTEAQKAATRYNQAPDPQAYYNGLSPGRQRLINAGLTQLNQQRVEPYRQRQPQQPPQQPPQPRQRQPRQRQPQQPPPPPQPRQPRMRNNLGQFQRQPQQPPTPQPRQRQPRQPQPTPQQPPQQTQPPAPTAAQSAATRYLQAPDPQAYYNGLSPGRQRLVDAGLTQLGVPRQTGYRRGFLGTVNRQTTTGTAVNVNGRRGNPIQLQNAVANTYYLTLTPTPPLRTVTEVREILARQRLSFFDPTRIYGVRVAIQFETGATGGGSIPSQMFLSAVDLLNAVINLVVAGLLTYGPMDQVEIEFTEV